ncbi:tRNA preQ1(34) S-adenosylmethionine ribosyltransferase-isomerase QueA [Treponema sp. HNW]|uniref:tRNA preQ1(34) S-adenosylmethionine ribosyltransferase-isomerase QueA n=1 Tax=Treponema sp. HNW TaxID=3116654 RepID=UPI003D0B876D
MLTKDFYFDLPDELIAQYPSKVRGEDKLMVLNKTDGRIFHHMIDDLPDLIEEGALMVFNNSKVRPSRCYAEKIGSAFSKPAPSSKPVEFLLLEPLGSSGETPSSNGAPAGTSSLWRAMVKNAKKHKPGNRYRFADGSFAEIVERAEDAGTEFRTLSFERSEACRAHESYGAKKRFCPDEAWFERNGHMPLPPYIKRSDTEEDASRYQTVYAEVPGSVACPTAGLHFTEALLERLANKGIERVSVTLHVGLGTFLPVRSERIEDHVMHREVYTVSPETAEAVNRAKKEGRPVIAVGTTAVRTLESAWKDGALHSGSSSTNIFLYPGCTFNAVDKLITNFHTPESTLLMLVSAFSGKEHIFNAYKKAVENRYRFFSYGDAMFIR